MTQCIAHARKVAVLVSVVLLWSVQASFAATVVYTDEAAFLAAAGPDVVMESFEGGDQMGGDLVTTSKFRIINNGPSRPAPVIQDSVKVFVRPTVPQDDVLPSDGQRLVTWDVRGENGELQFDFSDPGDPKVAINALGFWLMDAVDQPNPPATGLPDQVRLLIGNNFDGVAAQGWLPSMDKRFFGVISDDPFKVADLTHTGLNPPDGIGIDQVYFRPAEIPFDVVPEPMTLSLAALGVLAIGGYARKRRSKQA